MQKAQETGFCQRNRKLSPRYFFRDAVDQMLFIRPRSLMGHAIDLKLNRDIDIKKQSIYNKFTDKAVDFLKALLSVQLSRKFTVPSKFLDMFSSVHDSTRFGLPESFTEHYRGCGGRGAPAGGKIQFAYDLKSH